MATIYEGKMSGESLRFGIVVSRWNDLFTEPMLQGALDALTRHGVDGDQIDVARVPGTFEIPVVAQRLAKSGKYDAVVCIGCLIRGATPHFDYLSSAVTSGIAQINLQTGVPVTYGIITVENLEQAMERSGSKAGNKGAEAALAALEMANVLKQLD